MTPTKPNWPKPAEKPTSPAKPPTPQQQPSPKRYSPRSCPPVTTGPRSRQDGPPSRPSETATTRSLRGGPTFDRDGGSLRRNRRPNRPPSSGATNPATTPTGRPPPGRVLLASQTVGLLSGEGGCGKSSLTQQLALAADARTPTGAGLGDIRLAIAPGPVVIWQLEDRAALVLHRLRATAELWKINPEALDQVAVVAADDTAELWRSADFDRTQHGPTEAFAALAADIATVRPRLVIIDPALCAVYCAPSDAATVRAFVTTVARLVGPNAAVLIVAHSTKEARTNAEGGPGVVSGSAAWYDAARLVINAHRPRDAKGRIVQDAHRQHVLLDAVKANLGEAGQIGTGALQVATSGRWPAGLIPTATTNTNGERPSLDGDSPPRPCEPAL